jgi:hypothetical protein
MRALFPEFLVVSALLVVAGAGKVRSPVPVSAVVSGVRLPLPLVAVRTLGVAEVAIGAGAAVHPTHLTVALVALAYGAFCAFVLWGRPLRCGCFGDAPAGGWPAHVALNAIMCSGAILAALAPPPGVVSLVGRSPLIAMPLGLGVAAATVAAYLLFTAFPAAWHAYRGELW